MVKGVSSHSFSSQIDEWVKETQERMLAVFRESTQRTVSNAQQMVPIDTGFLRASVRASLNGMPPIDREAKPTAPAYGYDDTGVVMTIANAELGDTIYVGWTAAYAAHVEYGTSKMVGRGFVAIAALAWPNTVYQVSQELKARVTQANLDRALGVKR